MSTAGGVPPKVGSNLPVTVPVSDTGGVDGAPVPVRPKAPVPTPAGDSDSAGDGYDTSRPPKLSKGASTAPDPGSVEEDIYNNVFAPNGITYPVNSDASGANLQTLRSSPGYKETVAAGTNLLNEGSEQALSQFISQFSQLPVCGNVMETLLQVIKDSIIDTNEDKRYYLTKLNGFNDIAKELSTQLKEMSDASSTLSDSEKDKKGDDLNNCRVDATIRCYNTNELGADGKPVLLSEERKHLSRSSLGDATKDVERQQEDLRNNRQMAQTAFQAADQRVNQLFQILASVVKDMNEERSGPIKNFL